MILRARVVLPVSGPAIEDGMVRIAGRRLVKVGRWGGGAGFSRKDVIDLGEVVLMPGLINSHCHLDYTHMAGQFPPPRVFSDWLKDITSTKAGWSLTEYAESWRAGADMLVRTGTTTVADIEAVPQLLPDVWNATPLRVFSFLELIGITTRRPPELVMKEALEKLASLQHPRSRAALSPHAPYSTVPQLLRLSAKAASEHRALLCTHVAESQLEYEMFKRGKGAMYDWLQRSGRDMGDCGTASPVRHLRRCGVLRRNLLAVHANYLGPGDAALFAKGHVSVVHCPRSHSYFNHRRFPARRLLRAGVNVCLGTDSLATVRKSRGQALELNMFEEMRALADRERWMSPRLIVKMATMNGAKALGMEGRIGALRPGAEADLVALPCPGKTLRPYDSVLEHTGFIAGNMIGGAWAKAPQ